jgi:3-hydroxyisobutyrate dehydrogenase-like beta-hydroxyacid dehydrogenase
MTSVGILHPGAMGVSVAATLKHSGNNVWWASAGRSKESMARAEQQGLIDAGTLAALCGFCEVIVSVCPPDAAEATADAVLQAGFRHGGLYLDANAISPGRAQRIGQKLGAAGITFVDGGIIGGPAWKPGTTGCTCPAARRSARQTCSRRVRWKSR